MGEREPDAHLAAGAGRAHAAPGELGGGGLRSSSTRSMISRAISERGRPIGGIVARSPRVHDRATHGAHRSGEGHRAALAARGPPFVALDAFYMDAGLCAEPPVFSVQLLVGSEPIFVSASPLPSRLEERCSSSGASRRRLWARSSTVSARRCQWLRAHHQRMRVIKALWCSSRPQQRSQRVWEDVPAARVRVAATRGARARIAAMRAQACVAQLVGAHPSAMCRRAPSGSCPSPARPRR